jgi:hypothetical protein
MDARMMLVDAPRKKGIGAHHSPRFETKVWLTPPDILAAMGAFDLDPCAAPEPRPWATAAQHYTRADDGLTKPWAGRVWLNPPYGGPAIIGPWMRRMAAHNHGTALIFARTETTMFHRCVWEAASGVLFLEGRLFFHRPDGTRADGNAGAPSCLVAYGREDADLLALKPVKGHYVPLKGSAP